MTNLYEELQRMIEIPPAVWDCPELNFSRAEKIIYEMGYYGYLHNLYGVIEGDRDISDFRDILDKYAYLFGPDADYLKEQKDRTLVRVLNQIAKGEKPDWLEKNKYFLENADMN